MTIRLLFEKLFEDVKVSEADPTFKDKVDHAYEDVKDYVARMR